MRSPLPELLELLELVRERIRALRWEVEEGMRDPGRAADQLRQAESELDELRAALLRARRLLAAPEPGRAATQPRRSA